MGKKKKTDYSLILMFLFIFISIGCTIISIVMIYNRHKVVYIEKKNDQKEYIYTYKNIKSSDHKETYSIPIVNLKGSSIEKINQEIQNLFDKISKNTNYTYEYEFSQSDEILSLAIIYSYSNLESLETSTEVKEDLSRKYYFKTYNIDLIEGKLITDYNLYNRFNINEDDIKTVLESQFHEIYQKIVQDSPPLYTKDVCDYNCFLEKRGITTDYILDTSLYVEDHQLKVFKFYQKDSEYNDSKYFKDLTYKFVVKEKEGD